MDLCVFRDTRRRASARDLLGGLQAEVAARNLPASPARARRHDEAALLRAGEIESLLADSGSPRAVEAAILTDRLAEAVVGRCPPALEVSPRLVDDLPSEVRPSPPEGFAYYALELGCFARLARDLPSLPRAAAVVGIRTIGATLSAVVAAALRLSGAHVERITVRPTGHPYARVLPLDAATTAWIRDQRDRHAAFFVVDEGPGLSGSSFLSVAEALAGAGADPRSITPLGSRAVDPRTLLAMDAERRFAAFAPLRVALPAPPPDGAGLDLSAGAWRARTWGDEDLWPASWPALERAKYLTADRAHVLKFEGLGRWGDAVRARAEEVAERGFGPPLTDAGAGYASYAVIAGRPLRSADRSISLIERIADYCASRAAAFSAPGADYIGLREMVRHNTYALLGRAVEFALPAPRPVIADARLMPHEWILDTHGQAWKVDAAAHGDDHLYPGPTDIAWDLAGAIVEWDLDDGARAAFLDRYRRASGDRPERRLPDYLAAYAIAHLARAEMARAVHAGTPEAARWQREAQRYRAHAARSLDIEAGR